MNNRKMDLQKDAVFLFSQAFAPWKMHLNLAVFAPLKAGVPHYVCEREGFDVHLLFEPDSQRPERRVRPRPESLWPALQLGDMARGRRWLPVIVGWTVTVLRNHKTTLPSGPDGAGASLKRVHRQTGRAGGRLRRGRGGGRAELRRGARAG